jgi:segregation and condensation protein B
MTESESGLDRKSPANLPSLSAIVEAILFASDRPVSVRALQEAIPEADEEALLAALAELTEKCESQTSGVGLQELADGYQLTTRPSLSVYVERFLVGRRRARLSRAALETLATIAYRQPITRGEIEDLRGVDCGQVIHTLLTRELITVRGRSEALGRPLLYGTTPEFLTYFGLRSMGDLPNLEELRALADVDPLEDAEIREALEASGLLEGLDEEHAPEAAEEDEGASRLADPGSDAVGSDQTEAQPEPEDAASARVKDDDLGASQANGAEEAGSSNGGLDAGGEAPEQWNGELEAHGDAEGRTNGRRARKNGNGRKRPELRIVEPEAIQDRQDAGAFVATEGNGAH